MYPTAFTISKDKVILTYLLSAFILYFSAYQSLAPMPCLGMHWPFLCLVALCTQGNGTALQKCSVLTYAVTCFHAHF